MNPLTKYSAAALISLIAGAALALEAPDVVVKKAVEEVTAAINADQSIQTGNRQRINALVDQKVVPHLSLKTMTRAAAGPHWAKATLAQQQALTVEFKRLLTNTYSGAFTNYRPSTKIDYPPLRMAAGDTDAVVRSFVSVTGDRPIPVDYYLEVIDGDWKVVDFSVYGARMVETYKNQFTGAISSGGIDGLIKALGEKNNSIEGRNKS